MSGDGDVSVRSLCILYYHLPPTSHSSTFILPYSARSTFSPHLPRPTARLDRSRNHPGRARAHSFDSSRLYLSRHIPILPPPLYLISLCPPPSHLLFIPSSHCPHALIVCVVFLPTSLRPYRECARRRTHGWGALSDNQECVMQVGIFGVPKRVRRRRRPPIGPAG